MKQFCQECGSEVPENQLFCAECGTPVEQAASVGSEIEPLKSEPSKRVARQPKKPISFKKKLAFMLVGVLAVALIASHYTIQATTSPEDKINHFLTALEVGDTETVMSEITVPEGVGKDDKTYVEYLKSLDYTTLESNIVEAAEGIKDDNITRVITDENGDEIFKLKQDKYLSLYPVISIEAIPVALKLSTDLPSGSYEIAGKTFDLGSHKEKVSEFLPGDYEVVVSAEGIYSSTTEINQPLYGNEGVTIELLKEQLMATIESDIPEAIVLINQQSTGKTVEELSEIGPVFPDDSISIQLETDNGKSEEFSVEGGESIYITFEKQDKEETGVSLKEDEERTKELKEEVKEKAQEKPVKEKVQNVNLTVTNLQKFFWDFREAYETALNTKDFHMVTSYLQTGSIAYRELEEFVGDLGTDYFLYDFSKNSIVDVNLSGQTAYLTTYEEFDFTNHFGKTTRYKRDKLYEVLVKDEDVFEIVSIQIQDTKRSN